MAVYKRGTNWYARVSKPSESGYKRINKGGFATKREAQKWEAEILTGQLLEKDNNLLLADYFENWFKKYKTNRTDVTLHQYQNTLSVIKRYLPMVYLKNFNRDVFQTFLNKYGKNHSKETVSKRKGHLTACLKDALIDKDIAVDPTTRLNLVYNNETEKDIDDKFLEVHDAKSLIDYCSKNLSKSRFMILTGIYSGARFGELRALIDDDIDTKNKAISINKSVDSLTGLDKETKNKQSNRTINMPNDWFSLYLQYQHNDKRLFEISSNGINKELRKICMSLGIKSITFHALRHTHASMLLANNISMQYVSERLGHANLLVTEKVYAHLLETKRSEENKKAMSIF
ncbi:tyrosine-type recombinase/integrase [Oenococcus sicerae]